VFVSFLLQSVCSARGITEVDGSDEVKETWEYVVKQLLVISARWTCARGF